MSFPFVHSGKSMWELWVVSEQSVVANEDGQTWRQRCGTYEEVVSYHIISYIIYHIISYHIILNYIALYCIVWGHPLMTSTRSGMGQAQVDACGRGEGVCPMWTSTQKINIRVHWRHPLFFSCKEVGVFFTRILSLDGIKVDIFRRYKLII